MALLGTIPNIQKTKKFAEAEAEARTKKKGLWIDKDPVAPWDYRSNQKVKK